VRLRDPRGPVAAGSVHPRFLYPDPVLLPTPQRTVSRSRTLDSADICASIR